MSELSQNSITVQFVSRSANTVADYIAKSTCVISDRSWSGNDIPPDVNSVVLRDLRIQ